MSQPLSANAFLAALRAEGVVITQHDGWRTHNRGDRGDGWGPVHGIVIHHTAGVGDRMVTYCINGDGEDGKLPGPLCHGLIRKDGTFHTIGYGRTNHAGAGDAKVLRAVIAEFPLPKPQENTVDGNARFYGLECENEGNGNDPWPARQIDTIIRASAAICRAHGWGEVGDTSVIGHKEWQVGKPDPRGIDMDDLRVRIRERLQHPPFWTPPTTLYYRMNVAEETLAHHEKRLAALEKEDSPT
ncbi:N-acetylmuramoyl-L-alanine amidase [Streptomyces roseifaciens]